MQAIEVDMIGGPVLWVNGGDPPATQVETLTWPEARYLLGWAPWMGYGSQSCFESHYMLLHNDTQLFVRGPHRDSAAVMYDEARTSEFFPSGYGRYVRAGEPIQVELLVNPLTAVGVPVGAQANARIFSVKA